MPTLKKVLILTLVLATILAIAIDINASEDRGTIKYEGAPKFYAKYSSAVIFRVDDFVADPSYIHNITFHLSRKNVVFQNYQMELIDHLLKNYPDMRLVFGVITGDISGSNNSDLWSLYAELVKDYGWEAASHTRYHLPPPRSQADVLGSILDIEGNITGYKVYTYIPPYGKIGKGELDNLREAGVKIVMLDKPMQFNIPNRWDNMRITIKMDRTLPWKTSLKLMHSFENTVGGVLIVYTHATSFDWKSGSQLLNAFDYAISVVNDGKTWITVPSELYKYEVERKAIIVTQLNETSFRVELKKSMDFEPIPITLSFEVNRDVKAVYYDGSPLPKLNYFGFVPTVGFQQQGNNLVVSIYPGGTLTFDLSEE
jgi:peptidoglycan/xylan/chitin deacetylase (PgdA/CDA1 family)